MARLSGSATPTAEFFQTLSSQTISLINAIAAAIWLKSAQGLLQQQHQTNLSRVGLDDLPQERELHRAASPCPFHETTL